MKKEYEETMNLGRSLRSMGSMMSVYVNMDRWMYGDIVQTYSITSV